MKANVLRDGKNSLEIPEQSIAYMLMHSYFLLVIIQFHLEYCILCPHIPGEL